MAKRSRVGFSGEGGTGAWESTPKRDDFGGREYCLVSNIGLQGSILFSSQEDYDRFEAYLYILNAVESPRASNYFLDGREKSVFEAARGDRLVAIGAYSFTPKVFYVLASPLLPNGIAKFMQKLQTAYTMYFNVKYQRSGRIFHAAYRAEKAESNAHLKFLSSYVHLHPASLFNAAWEEEMSDTELRSLAWKASQYRYSSMGEYAKKQFAILDPEKFPKYIAAQKDPDILLRTWKQNKKQKKSNGAVFG